MMEQITLDMIPNGYTPTAHISQYDSGRHIRFNIQNITLTGSETVTLKIRKTNGELVTKIIENHTSYVEYVSEKADCDVSGKSNCEIVISKDDVVIGSKNFILNVEADPYDDAGVITKTASGRIVTFETNLADELQEVKCEINAKQDLHGEDKPYPAGGGVNIWDEEWENGNIDGNTGAKTSDNRMIRSKNYIPCVGNTQLKEVVANGNTNQMVLYFYDKDKNFIPYTGEGAYNNGYNSSAGLPTTPVNAAYMLFRISIDYGDTYLNNISINYPSTDTEYHTYENVCPIEGFTEANITRCGKQLWNEQYEVGQYNPSDGQPISVSNAIRNKGYIIIPASTSFALLFPAGISGRIFFFDNNKSMVSTETFGSGITVKTMPSGCNYIRFHTNTSYGETYNNDISINYPSTDTDYHAYNGQTFIVAFGQTVYGGVYDKSGRLTITHIKIDLGSLNYSYESGWRAFKAQIDNAVRVASGAANALSDIFTSVSGHYSGDSQADYTMAINTSAHGAGVCTFRDLSYTDATQFKTAMSGHELAYELATPIVIDVDAISVFAENGTNNVFSDTGNTEVKYLYNA